MSGLLPKNCTRILLDILATTENRGDAKITKETKAGK